MKQFTLGLREEHQRPVAYIPEFHELDALIDTGSVLPIWFAGEEKLQQLGGVKIRQSVPFGGLGGMTRGALYRLPLFNLGGLLYPNMSIIARHDRSMIMPLLLPATMFNNLIYEIDNVHHKLNITVPDTESHVRALTVKSENGRLHVACTSAENYP